MLCHVGLFGSFYILCISGSSEVNSPGEHEENQAEEDNTEDTEPSGAETEIEESQNINRGKMIIEK